MPKSDPAYEQRLERAGMQLEAIRADLHIEAARDQNFVLLPDEAGGFRVNKGAELDLAVFRMKDARLDPARGETFVDDLGPRSDAACLISEEGDPQTQARLSVSPADLPSPTKSRRGSFANPGSSSM